MIKWDEGNFVSSTNNKRLSEIWVEARHLNLDNEYNEYVKIK